jgi:hypothetical protein
MTHKKLSNAVKIIITALIATNLIFLTVALLGRVAGGYIEYYYYPVMVPGEFISAEEATNGYSAISYNAFKLRDCDWTETKWYFGNPEDHIHSLRIPMFHGEAPEIREVGEHIWRNTYINLPVEAIRDNSYAISFHSCNPFWETQSLFFVGKNVTSHIDDK